MTDNDRNDWLAELPESLRERSSAEALETSGQMVRMTIFNKDGAVADDKWEKFTGQVIDILQHVTRDVSATYIGQNYPVPQAGLQVMFILEADIQGDMSGLLNNRKDAFGVTGTWTSAAWTLNSYGEV